MPRQPRRTYDPAAGTEPTPDFEPSPGLSEYLAENVVHYNPLPGFFADAPGAVGDQRIMGNTLYVKTVNGWKQMGIMKCLPESPLAQIPTPLAWFALALRNGGHNGSALTVRRALDNKQADVYFDSNGQVTGSSLTSTNQTLQDFANETKVLFEPGNAITSYWLVGFNVKLESTGDYFEFTGDGAPSKFHHVIGTGGTLMDLDGTYQITFEARHKVGGGQLDIGVGFNYIFNDIPAPSVDNQEWMSYTFSVSARAGSSFANVNRRVLFSTEAGTVWQLRNVRLVQIAGAVSVVQWPEQMRAANLVSAVTAAQPRIAVSGNVLPAITFDGADDYMSGPATTFPSAPANEVLDIWIYMVATFARGTTTRAGVYGHDSGGNHPVTSGYRFGSSVGQITIKTRDASDNVVEVNAPQPHNNTFGLFTAHYRIGGGKVSIETFLDGRRLGGAEKATANQTYNSSAGSILGARSARDNFSKLEAREIVSYADTNLQHDRAKVEALLAGKHGIILTP